jgi:medium-chain acyl-[acyl-carrier-protein] hydrolase
VKPFEKLLETVVRSPKRAAVDPVVPKLSPEKQRLLALRLKQRAAAVKPAEDPWFPYAQHAGEAAWATSQIQPRGGAGIQAAGFLPRAAKPARPRLFCFPYAGGGALSYRSWIEPLAPAVAVCPARLPGRETRFKEQALTSMESLIEALEAAIMPYLDHPFSFFGHSMGAVIAFELARSLRRHGEPLPLALYASGARAPQFRLNWKPSSAPDDREFLDQLRRLDGVPAELLRNREALDYALPILRADAALYRNYVYEPEAALAIPIHAYGGSDDPNVRPEHLDAWREQTSAAFSRRELEGGHFFIHSARDAFLSGLLDDLR